MGKIAFVFSGQGAQYSGMGKELFESDASARAVFDMADRIRPGTSNQCFSAPKEILSQTINTQPCLFAMDLACAAALENAGVAPVGAAGFSLGETAAVSFCKMMSDEEAFSFVCKRAEIMDRFASERKGAMAAVLKLENDFVEELCRQAGEVYPVNYNCPGQLVAAGTEEAVEELSRLVSQNGGKAMKLPVSGAFHSPFMAGASKELEEYLSDKTLFAPKIPLYSNLTAEPYGKDAALLLSKQVSSPVLWQRTIENMIRDGFDTFIEVGAGKTLSSLIKKISGEVKTYNVENPEGLKVTVQAVMGGQNAER